MGVPLRNLKASLSRSQIPESDTLSWTESFFRKNGALSWKFVRNLRENMEILPSKRFKSYSRSTNNLHRLFGVKNDNYGPCLAANFYKNDTPSRSQNPENDTLFSGTPRYKNIRVPPPRDMNQGNKFSILSEKPQ